jgi:hypothetical protein
LKRSLQVATGVQGIEVRESSRPYHLLITCPGPDDEPYGMESDRFFQRLHRLIRAKKPAYVTYEIITADRKIITADGKIVPAGSEQPAAGQGSA